jgi:DMSO/TMAO reductase YedYZ molybdopterin-dependent catalytic subunit
MVPQARSIGRGALAGASAAAAAALALLGVRVAAGGPALPELVQDAVVGLIPGPLFSFALDRLKFAGKPLLFTLILVGQLGVGAAIGALYARRERAPRSAVLLGGSVYLILLFVALPMLGAGFLGAGRSADVPVWLSTLVGVTVFAVVLHALSQSAAATEEPDADRRRLVRLAASGGALAALGLFGWRVLPLLPPSGSRSTTPPPLAPAPTTTPVAGGPSAASADDHPTPEITPVGLFYNVSKNFVDPKVSLDGWRLQVGGLVEKPFTLTYDELRALPAVEEPATLCCISNDVGGGLIGNAVWKGVRLKDLLDRAGVRPGAKKVVWTCRDDYRDSITVDRALQPGTILAYEMNGQPLTDKHGFPVRVVVPGIYGMKNAKWLEKIDVVDGDFQGYWQQQGWSDAAPYQTMSRIDKPVDGEREDPGKVAVYGIAFAGDRGISKVELTFDGGKSWQPARMRPPLGPYTWVRWSIDWDAPPGANATVEVRATDGKGELQSAEETNSFPDGATGYHTIRLRTSGG